MNISYASFHESVQEETSFINTDIKSANFSFVTITRGLFDDVLFADSDVMLTDFSDATMRNTSLLLVRPDDGNRHKALTLFNKAQI